jgi:methylmalonyl-CoA mutase N-terminal domain/subunit
MAAVLGGAQSLHTNSLDEAYALPGEHAVTIALRTQQVLAYESGVTNVADPLGGSYFLEKLTLDSESAANDYIRRIDEMGGMIAAIEAGFPQTEIASASYRYQREIESGARTIVGVNRFQSAVFQSDAEPIELLHVDEAGGRRQTAKLAALRARRDNGNVQKTLDALRRAAEGTQNTMPLLLDAVRAYATLGEICDALRGVFGTYRETPHI